MNTTNSLQPLSSNVLPPTRRLLPAGSWLAIALSLSAVATLSGAALVGHHLVTERPEQPAVQVIVMNKAPPESPSAAQLPAVPVPTVVPESTPDTTPIAQAPVLPTNSDHALVFNFDGHTYVAIDTVDTPDPYSEAPFPTDTFPRHGTLRVVGDLEYPSGVTAPLKAADLDANISAWLGHPLRIDSRCETTVDEFALISLISGAPLEYLGPFDGKGDGKRDLAASLQRYGNTVIAGRIQSCSGNIARSALLPTSHVGIEMHDARLQALAKDRFLSSELSAKAQRSYIDNGFTGNYWEAEENAVSTQMFRHPVTGQALISIQAVVDHGCGGADINLWGLYEVTSTGALVQKQLIDAEYIIGVRDAIDIDGDGTFEFSALNSNADPALITAEGDVLRVLEAPFYGCSC